ncbi:MAG: hypothetical protein NTX03_07025 [Bacteroidetes bacterium]|nr:hypothetical protein [Bacteroidota bacterium]
MKKEAIKSFVWCANKLGYIIVLIIITKLLGCSNNSKELVIEKYKNGKIKYKYYKVNGVIEGVRKYYDSLGHLCYIANFTHDTANGLVKYFYENGKLKSVGNLRKGKLNGISYRYDTLGNVFEERYYKNEDLLYQVIYSDSFGNRIWELQPIVEGLPDTIFSDKIYNLKFSILGARKFELKETYIEYYCLKFPSGHFPNPSYFKSNFSRYWSGDFKVQEKGKYEFLAYLWDPKEKIISSVPYHQIIYVK